MNKSKIIYMFFGSLMILLTLVITILGILSFNMNHSYYINNQYGDSIKIWGYGIYKHDSYFKVPIFVGSDVTMLVFVVPSLIYALIKVIKEENLENLIRALGVCCLILYYSVSIAFGVTYNKIHLIYIGLVTLSFFGVCLLLAKLHKISILKSNSYSYKTTKPMEIFLLVSGIAVFIAWLPEIIASLVKGTSLSLIEVYTTEITYVLDMGIIGPLMIITFVLIRNKKFMGYILLRMSFLVCVGVGIMLPVQSIFQIISGYPLSVGEIFTKVLIFVFLAGFATYFQFRLKKSTIKLDILTS